MDRIQIVGIECHILFTLKMNLKLFDSRKLLVDTHKYQDHGWEKRTEDIAHLVSGPTHNSCECLGSADVTCVDI